MENKTEILTKKVQELDEKIEKLKNTIERDKEDQWKMISELTDKIKTQNEAKKQETQKG